jgi:hypothetical protein
MQAVQRRVDLDAGRFAVHLPGPLAGLFAADMLASKTSGDGVVAVLPVDDGVFARLAEVGCYIPELSPFNRHYAPPLIEGEFPPMPHQLETAAFLAAHPRAYCTSEMRTGKTGAVVMALDFLARHVDSGGALIVCPASVMDGVWRRAIESTLPGAACGVLRGSAERRLDILAKGHPYNVINYEGLAVIADGLDRMLRRGAITKVVIDELSHYGNTSSDRWKAANRLFNSPVRPVKRLWGLTGTPGADSLAVHGMCRMVNDRLIPWKSKGAWRGAVQYHYGHEAWMWRDKREAAAIIGEVMRPNIRFTKEAALKTLPPLRFRRVEAPLTPPQAGARNDLTAALMAELAGGAVVEAKQKAALLSKLFQVAMGAVISDRGPVELDSGPRDSIIANLVLGSEAKSVVFCSYVAAGDKLARTLGSMGISAARVDGTVTGSARDKVFSDFQRSSRYKVLVAHPQTTAYGTELAAADQLIFNGPMMSGTHTYLQGLQRLSSARQTAGSIAVIEVCSTDEEARFFDSLRARGSHAKSIGLVFEKLVEDLKCRR